MNKNNTESLMIQGQGQQQLSVLGAFADGAHFQMAMQAAEMLAKSNMIPTTYQGNPGSCFIALNTALRLRMDPLMIMQNLYVVQGRPSWSGQFAIALVNACGLFSRTWYEEKNGEDCRDGLRMCAERMDGSVVRGSWITPEMVKAEGWGKKWQTMPEQMYQYRAAAFFARANCPEVLFGLSVEGEAEDVAGSGASAARRPLFKGASKDAVAADVKGLPEPQGAEVRQMTALEASELAGGVVNEVEDNEDQEAGPVEKLMIALSCTEAELDALISRASDGKVSGWRGLNARQLLKLAQNPERLQAEGGAK